MCACENGVLRVSCLDCMHQPCGGGEVSCGCCCLRRGAGSLRSVQHALVPASIHTTRAVLRLVNQPCVLVCSCLSPCVSSYPLTRLLLFVFLLLLPPQAAQGPQVSPHRLRRPASAQL